MASSASTRTQMKWQNLEEERKQQKSSSSMARSNSEYATSSPSSSSSSSSSSSLSQELISTNKDNEEDVCSSTGCATPKAKRFRIPEVLTCPPAPKKRRVNPNYSSKSPIAFFASPDIELFFFSALRNVSSA